MATKPSLGNQLYLYQLLSAELGVGKQAFLPRVEEVLAADGIDPYDLGAESTVEMLEMLDGFVKLTVFKGGRVYATVVRNEEWDALLEKAQGDGGKAKAGGKPWKRSKKSAKPVKPRHRKRPEPEPEPKPSPEPEPEPAPKPEPEPEPVAEAEAAPAVREEPAPEPAPTPAEVEAPADGTEPEANPPTDSAEAGRAPEAEPVPDEPEPAISLTITYDPDDAREPLEEPEAAPVEAAAPQQASAATQHTPANAEPTLPDGYPLDLAADVYCPPDLLSELSYLLPYGADIMGIMNEYYYIALERGTLEQGRSRAAFPLRYSEGGERASVTVRLKKRSGGPGLGWAVEAVERG